jgi:hypothetical protein
MMVVGVGCLAKNINQSWTPIPRSRRQCHPQPAPDVVVIDSGCIMNENPRICTVIRYVEGHRQWLRQEVQTRTLLSRMDTTAPK